MTPAQLIARKRDGYALTRDEIAFLMRGLVDGSIPEYQISAWAMAVFFQGMTDDETSALTEEMLYSGATLHWDDGPPLVDKHSTGGTGDKVSLILAPLLACCGLRVPMISGRGLGPTGGTLDKLESIPGFRTDLSIEEMQSVVEQIGCVITGATGDLVPADRKLYALRDVSGTVPSIPLITASIMSKKLAESLDALVLDVKCGTGAFMQTHERAMALAGSLVRVGRDMRVTTTALVTDMNQPLGRMCGNAVEVNESIACLQGDGPDDLRRLTVELGAELLVSTDIEDGVTAATSRLESLLDSGRAFERFEQLVQAQGGNLNAPRPVASERVILSSERGFVESIDTTGLANAIIELGGGRRRTGDAIDHSVGLEMLVRLGDEVRNDSPLVRVFGRCDDALASRIAGAISIGGNAQAGPNLISRRVSG